MRIKTLSLLLLLGLSTPLPLAHAGMWGNIIDQTAGPSNSPRAPQDLDVDAFPSWPDFTPKNALAQQRDAAQKVRQKIEKLLQIDEDKMNFDTIFKAYDQIISDYNDATNYINFIHLVRDLEGWDNASEKIADNDHELITWLTTHQELKNAFLLASEQADTEDFDNPKTYYIFNRLMEMAQSGIDLDTKDQDRINELRIDLSYAEAQYEDNIIQATAEAIVLVENHEKALLMGLPDEMIDAARELAQSTKQAKRLKNAWLFNDPYTLLHYADNEALRERAWHTIDQIATQKPYNNAPVLDKILSMREELAKLLDYPSFADLEADKTMLASTENAVDILKIVEELSLPLYTKYMEELRLYINKEKGSNSPTIKAWDLLYYIIKRDAEKRQFDEYEFCQYYPYEHVRDSIFAYFGELFGLSIEEIPSQYVPLGSGKKIRQGAVSVWDPRVQVYSVRDKESGRHMSYFYLDAFQRADKSEGSWAYSLQNKPKIQVLNTDILPGEDTEPDLLAGAEIHALTHELGHVLHFIMSETELAGQASYESNQDFIETPSQLLEQWLLDRDFMHKLSCHVETGKHIPYDLLDSYIASRDSNKIIEDILHLQEVKLDLEMHLHYATKFKNKNLNQASQAIIKNLDRYMSPAGSSPLYRLATCISGGYEAKYYAYIWSNILVADIFSVFQAKGIHNKQVAKELREKVLRKGASIPPVYLLEDFLGREIEPAPYFKHQGYLD